MLATDRSTDKLVSIQYVRAIASVIVVGWHTGWSYTVLGQAGVDLFFVVSGFVMMLVSGRERSPGRFAVARLLRIVPLYWAVTLIVAFLDSSAAAKVVTSLSFWPDGGFPLVIQGWSLNLEMMYYLLFALALFGPSRLRVRLLVVEFVILCVVVPLVLPINEVVTAWANPIAIEFLAGACLYRLWQADYIPIGAAAWTMGIAGTVVLCMTHLLGGAPAGWPRVAFWGIPALAIVAAGLGIERAGQLPTIKILEELGEGSYSIYLTHLLALRFIAAPLYPLWAPVALALAAIWCCVAGYLVHRAIELPTYRLTAAWLRRYWPKRLALVS